MHSPPSKFWLIQAGQVWINQAIAAVEPVASTPNHLPVRGPHQDVEISVFMEFLPEGYCETFFLFVTCGWDFHESPNWDGETFTPLDVSTYTATETLPFPSSDGDTKLFYFTYGFGEFFGFGDTGNQTISILMERASDTAPPQIPDSETTPHVGRRMWSAAGRMAAATTTSAARFA